MSSLFLFHYVWFVDTNTCGIISQDKVPTMSLLRPKFIVQDGLPEISTTALCQPCYHHVHMLYSSPSLSPSRKYHQDDFKASTKESGVGDLHTAWGVNPTLLCSALAVVGPKATTLHMQGEWEDDPTNWKLLPS